MKKYTGTKTVQAEPMVLGEYINNCMSDHIYNPYTTNGSEQHLLSDPGYHVVHEDGQSSWSSAEAFEKAYKPSETFIERLEIECDEVEERLNKLRNFMNSDAFERLDFENRSLLYCQESEMDEYYLTLCRRLALAKETEEHMDHNYESN